MKRLLVLLAAVSLFVAAPRARRYRWKRSRAWWL
jgi:hypothetical protein